jgi:hypothetical protein
LTDGVLGALGGAGFATETGGFGAETGGLGAETGG